MQWYNYQTINYLKKQRFINRNTNFSRYILFEWFIYIMDQVRLVWFMIYSVIKHTIVYIVHFLSIGNINTRVLI